jgi:ABC-type Mn2+/Zn2+ transport system ATPase subunit
MAGVLLQLDNVTLGYSRPLMRPVSFCLHEGEFWGIAGPNGAGKTTLIKTMLGLLRPIAGSREVLRPGLRFGYVPQRHTLNHDYPLSAFDVALMDRGGRLRPPSRPSGGDRARVADELERLGLGDKMRSPYAALSGGQQQRVLLARALAADPDVLILDEPASGIDVLGGADIHAFLRQQSVRGLTIVMISHSLAEIVSVVSHLGLMNRETDVFETGPITEMVTTERLSRLFGRAIRVHRCDGRLHIDVPVEAA